MSFGTALLLVVAAACSSADPVPAEPVPIEPVAEPTGGEEPPPPEVPFSLRTQSVGEVTDGLLLRAVTHEAPEGHARIVFELSRLDGSEAPVPLSTATLDGEAIVVSIGGVREDATELRPLTGEDGRPLGEARPIDAPPVRAIARLLVLDDSEVRYRIELAQAAPFRLLALHTPTRIAIDVERGAGTRSAAAPDDTADATSTTSDPGTPTSQVPRIRTGEVTVGPALPREVIVRVMRAHNMEVRRCYERALAATPDLEGRVTVRFEIAPDGSVPSASTSSSTLGNAEVESCVVGVVRAMQFPEPAGGGIVVVSYPYVFMIDG